MAYQDFKVIRRDSDTSTVSDGQPDQLSTNPYGRLKVSTLPGDYDAITGNITAAQAAMNTPVANATLVASISRASNVNMFVTGTFNGTFTFDGSIDGGTTWFGVQAVRTNSNTVETSTGTLSAMPAYGWELSVNALTHVRVRCTAYTSGTAAWRILPGAYATEPIPAVQTHAVTIGASATSIGKAEDAAAATGDVGVPDWGVRRDAATVSASATGDYSEKRVDQYGQTAVFPGVSGTDTVSGVAASATSVTVLAANTSRKGATFYNASTATLYLHFGTTASIAQGGYAVAIPPSGYYELPQPIRQAVISGIWSAANGYVNVTESI